MKLKDYKLRYSNRAIMLFEMIANKPFEIGTLTDLYLFFYSVLMANNPDTFKLTFDDFIDRLDDEEDSLMYLANWLIKELAIKGLTQEKKSLNNLNA